MILVIVFSFLFIIYKSKRLTEYEQNSTDELAKFIENQENDLKKFIKNNENRLNKLKTEQDNKSQETTEDIEKKQKDFEANQKKQLANKKKEIERDKLEVQKDITNGRDIGWRQATAFWGILFIFYLIITSGREINFNFGQSYSLTVKTKPANTEVKIMNIKPKYKDGIRLKPGQYVIKAQHPYYRNKYQCVTIKNENVVINMKLRKK